MQPVIRSRGVLAVVALASAAMGAGLLPGVASADVKIVAKVNVKGAGVRSAAAQSYPQTVTTYFRGSKIRTETPKSVTIYDTATQKVYALDPVHKTYRVVSMEDSLRKAPGVMSRIQFNTSATMKATGETRMIAGRRARKYVGSASVNMALSGMPGASFPTTKLQIEQWTAESIKLPNRTRQMASGFARVAGPLGTMRGMKPLLDAVAKMKGTPLSSTVTMTVIPPAASNKPARGPMVTMTDVVSVREQPLSDKLFVIPAGYRKLERRTASASPFQSARRPAPFPLTPTAQRSIR